MGMIAFLLQYQLLSLYLVNLLFNFFLLLLKLPFSVKSLLASLFLFNFIFNGYGLFFKFCPQAIFLSLLGISHSLPSSLQLQISQILKLLDFLFFSKIVQVFLLFILLLLFKKLSFLQLLSVFLHCLLFLHSDLLDALKSISLFHVFDKTRFISFGAYNHGSMRCLVQTRSGKVGLLAGHYHLNLNYTSILKRNR